MEACASLHLGRAVRFVEFRTGQLRRGKVIAKHPTQATMFEEAVRRSWKIPYVSIEAAAMTPGDIAKLGFGDLEEKPRCGRSHPTRVHGHPESASLPHCGHSSAPLKVLCDRACTRAFAR